MAYTKVKPLMVASFPSSRLTGAFGAISGANLTGLGDGIDTKDASNDPTISTNPATGVGTVWLNKSTGELFNCKDATAGSNIWVNIGSGSGDVEPYTFDAIGDRGIFNDLGKDVNGVHNEYISIPTLGNSTDFGNTTVIRNGPAGATSNGTRGVMAGGYQYSSGTYRNDIDYVTISTPGNATDFGNLTEVRSTTAGAGNVTRATFSGGHGTSGHSDFRATIDYITVATTGNATAFGSLSSARSYVEGCSSDTRDTTWGGYTAGYVVSDTIDYVTSATLGNAADFGNLTNSRGGSVSASSNGIRGIGFGGDGPVSNIIDYVTLATTGNATDFGNMGAASASVGSMANDTRAVCARNGNQSGRPAEYVTIATTGNATTFGTIDEYCNTGLSGD